MTSSSHMLAVVFQSCVPRRRFDPHASPRSPHRAAHGAVTVLATGVLLTGAHAQRAPDRHNALYLELLGNAGAYSVNYERFLVGSLYARIGAGYMAIPESDSDEVDGLGMIPLMLGYVTTTAPHRLEVSVGVAPVLTSGDWDDVGLLSSETDVVGTGTVGYRFAPAGRSILFRAAFTPWFGSTGFTPWGGVSLGYRF